MNTISHGFEGHHDHSIVFCCFYSHDVFTTDVGRFSKAKLFKAEISMADVELREGASQEIVLPVEDQSPQVQSGQTALRIRNPQGAKLLAGCHTHSTELGTAPAGTWLPSKVL